MFLLNRLSRTFYSKLNPVLSVKTLEQKCVWKYCSNKKQDYYTILGLKPLATDEEIKEAYYNLSKQHHPDRNFGNEENSAKILEINEAFEILGNKDRREKYNQKMFPQIEAEKVKRKFNFIYEHTEYYEPPAFQRKIFQKPVYSHTYQQFLKHSKGDRKRKHRHSQMKINFCKMMSHKFSANISKK